MSIQIKPEPQILVDTLQWENCIFCNESTIYWTEDININRPVCPVCSVSNNNSDIPSAEFNY